MKHSATLSDIAAKANVSINTVSRALNGRSGVNESTRKRIQELARQCNYLPNINARTMRGLECPLISIVVSDIEDPFFVQVVSGVEEYANKEGISIVIGNSHEDHATLKKCMDQHLSFGCRSMIVVPVNEDKHCFDDILRKGVKLVLADRTLNVVNRFNQVTINNYLAAKKMVNHLIERGHKRIAIINQKSEIATESDRTKGYYDALAENGIAADERYVCLCENTDEVEKAVQYLIALDQPPTALFLAKDRLALSALRSINLNHMRIPEDISVVIYGMPEWVQTMRPQFTCLSRPIKEIGRTAARMLINQMRGIDKETITTICYDAEIIPGDSVRNIG